MAHQIDIESIRYVRDQTGRAVAVVRFDIEVDERPHPCAQDFSVEVSVLRDDGNEAEMVRAAWATLHQITRDLSDQTAHRAG